MLPHGVEQLASLLHVRFLVEVRLLHRFPDERSSREVHHAIDLLGLERLPDLVPVADAALDQKRERVDGVPVPGGEIVEHDHGVARPHQLFHDDASDVPGAPDDERVHAGKTARRISRRDSAGSGVR